MASSTLASARNSHEDPEAQRTSIDLRTGLDHLPITSTLHSLSKALHARRKEYTRAQKIKVKIGTWNVAACAGTENDLGAWFVDGKGVDVNFGWEEGEAEGEGAGGVDKGEGEGEGEGGTVSGVKRESSILQGAGDNIPNAKKSTPIPQGAEDAIISAKNATPVPKVEEGTIPGGDEIGIYVLGLQEVVELTSAKEYIGRVYADAGPTNRWRKALMDALPPGYVLIAEQQLSGLLQFIYASPTIAPTISSVSTVSVGTGIMGYLGNKGAVTTRIVLGETTRLVFVNCHLASGTDPAHLDRRYWDVAQILQRTHFEPINWSGVLDDAQEGIGEEDFAFWFGDLNFRLDGLPGDDIRRILMLHTKGEYDLEHKSQLKTDSDLENDSPVIVKRVESDSESEDESEHRTNSTFDKGDDASSSTLPDPDDFLQDPSQDPASLQATIDSLLPHDQLRNAQKHRKAFHDGWREGPITFLPTYKYDLGSVGMFDSSEKKRPPSWCDRILFRTRKDKLEYDGKTQEEELARIKDEEMKARGMDQAGEEEEVLFDYNPDEDGETEVESPTSVKTDLQSPKSVEPNYHEYDEYDETEEVVTKEGYVDKISLDVYTSHQKVLSSDHKPLDAVFTLEYDAVVPELKSKIQQEVARELDRAENEGRPGITVVVDYSADEDVTQREGAFSRRPSSGGADGVDFGKVAFRRRKFRSLTIANTSQVKASFTFVERPGPPGETPRVAPPWLSVCFIGSSSEEDRILRDLNREVDLEPGDAVNATLELYVEDMALVRSLNEGKTEIDDVLVLSVVDGRDHFIPIHGSWLQSCFGRSIDELIRVPEGGVRSLLPRRDGGPGGPVNRGQPVHWSAPRELFKLTETVDHLIDRVVADMDILEDAQPPKDLPAWPFDPKSWRMKEDKAREVQRSNALEALDSDKNLHDSLSPEIPAFEKLEIIAEILTTFLSSLTDGIVTEDLWAKLEADIIARGAKQLTKTEEIKNWVLDSLSITPNHNISFVFLTSMLCRVAGELAPVPKAKWKEDNKSALGGIEMVRRSMSWKGRPPPLPSDPAILRRQAVEKAFVELFAGLIFRGPAGLKDGQRRVMEEKWRGVLGAFLRAEHE